MKKLCVVPFTRRELPMLPGLRKGYQISDLVAPKGIAFEGEDVGALKNMNPMGQTITDDLDVAVGSTDVVFVSYVPSRYQSLRKYALHALFMAANSRKEIHCFLELTNDEKEAVNMACEKSQTSIAYYTFAVCDDKIYDLTRLHKFDVPVIYVSEEVPDCDGYEIFLMLAEKLSIEGKNVLAISEDVYNTFLGYECMKFGGNTEVGNQIFRLNILTYELYQAKHPDIILIKLPHPLMKYDDESLFDCGGTAYILSQAIPGDGCIYCTHAEVSGGTYWETFNEGVIAKFGYPIICVNVSNRIIDNAGDIHLSSLRIPENKVISRVKDMRAINDIPFLHLYNENDMQELYQKLLNEYLELPYGVI